ncbi:AAA family ATPase [Candidatus Fermentibacteria bacterium]|nr:AAA family ATPase [Candidatus Fermentibacteria bacterium]
MIKLGHITVRGFKSIRDLARFEVRNLNVLIGANGAGKSNFLSLFKLLNWMGRTPGELQLHVGMEGGASSLLHDGPAMTPAIEVEMVLVGQKVTYEHRFRLAHAAEDTLVFAEEQIRLQRLTSKKSEPWGSLGSGHRETRLLEAAENQNLVARALHNQLRDLVVYQFHNTSQTARVRQRWNVDDNHALKEDAANLAPILRRLREDEPHCYRQITETLRAIAPFFADFVLEPQNGTMLLQWREVGSDVVFGPHQSSDGSLRAMALITLLLLPEGLLPSVIILDEPELGLHPSAVEVVGGLIRNLSRHRQVIIATQSAAFVNQFEPADIVVVERKGRESVFTQLDEEALREWLTDYSLAELWEKNVIGGTP